MPKIGPQYPGNIKMAYIANDGDGGLRLKIFTADGQELWWPIDLHRASVLFRVLAEFISKRVDALFSKKEAG